MSDGTGLFFRAGRGTAGNSLPLNAPWGAVGDSWQATEYNNVNANFQSFNYGYVPWNVLEQGGNGLQMAYQGNLSVSGQNTTQIAAQVPGVLAAMPGPGLIFVDGGLVDISNLVPAATIFANQQSTVNALVAAGHRVFLLAIPPSDPSNPVGPSSEAIRLQANTMLATLATRSIKVINSDGFGLVHADYADSIHLNTWPGYELFGAQCLPFLQPWLPTTSTVNLGTTEYTSNSALAGGTTAPTGWTIDASAAGGATVVGSKVGGKWRITVSGTYTGTSALITLQQQNFGGPNPVTGNFVEALASYTLQGTPTNMFVPNVVAVVYDGSFNNLGLTESAVPINGVSSSTTYATTRGAGSYITKGPQVKVATGTPAVGLIQMQIGLFATATPLPCAMVIDFDYAALRKAS